MLIWTLLKKMVKVPFGPVGMSCQSPLFWWHSSWGYKGGCSQASGHSGWCWAQVWPGRVAPCIAAGQTSGWDWVRRHGSWYFGASRIDCRTASQTRGRGGSETWSDALGELQQTKLYPYESNTEKAILTSLICFFMIRCKFQELITNVVLHLGIMFVHEL